MGNNGLVDLLEESAGIDGVLQRARESYPGQEVKRNCRVMNEGCANNVSMDLKQMGLLGNRFYGRNHLFFVRFHWVLWSWLGRGSVIVKEMNTTREGKRWRMESGCSKNEPV